MNITPDKKTLVCLLNEKNEDKISGLFKEADRIRKIHAGEAVHLRGIIEFSNYCRRNCLYCGLRRDNRFVKRYRMTPEEIIACAAGAADLKITTVVLQSGEDSFYSTQDLCRIVSGIKKLGLAVTLSAGEKTYEDYRRLKDAGTDRYLLRFETSDETLYEKLRPGRKFNDRIKCLLRLKKLKYQTGSGIMAGLPGQSLESIADDILLFNDLDLDMVGIGPFLPHPNTPLRGIKSTDLTTVLKVTALTRITTKNTHIPATTATGTLDPRGRQKALECGANVIMPNITPQKYRKYYEIYPNKICTAENALKCGSCVKKMIREAGRKPGEGFGHSLKMQLPRRGSRGGNII